MPDARSLHGQHEPERELAPVVALQLADPERQRSRELAEKGQARALVEASVETQHPKARAIIQGGVLKGPAPRDLDELDVDLNALAGLGLLKQLHLPRHPLARPPQPRQPQIAKEPLACTPRDPNVVDPPQPHLPPPA